jgi:amphi-Trp domain-containing protein
MGRELKAEGTMDLERVAGYLNELADSMLGGTISVQKGQDYVVLKPASPVWVEVEAQKGKTKETLSIEVSWVPSDATQQTDRLIISSQPPVVEPEGSEEGEASDDSQSEDQTSDEDDA